MAKKATPAGGKSVSAKNSKSKGSSRKPTKAISTRRSDDSDFNAVDALLKLLQSPLVADLLAVGATAAMAAVTERRHTRRSGGDAAAKTMMKAAGAAAAAAIGRRLADEFEEIRNVSKRSKERAEA